jgi:hypothetical protein
VEDVEQGGHGLTPGAARNGLGEQSSDQRASRPAPSGRTGEREPARKELALEKKREK